MARTGTNHRLTDARTEKKGTEAAGEPIEEYNRAYTGIFLLSVEDGRALSFSLTAKMRGNLL